MVFPKSNFLPLLTLVCVLSFTVIANGQADLDTKIDSIFSSQNNNNSPGAAVIVIKNGKVLAKKAYGMASIEFKVPFDHRSVVRINYSEGREFISIAAVMMEMDGKIDLNDTVRKYFPDLPAWSNNVSVWDLMNHRSGFVDEWANLLLTQANMANRVDKSQFLRLLYTQPRPEIEPGKGYMYSNSDFGLLRLILEKASGEKLSVWMKRRMFDPLKMTSTRQYADQLEVIPNFARMYSDFGDGRFKLKHVDKTSPGANYFIATSADDLALWASAMSDPNSEIARATAKLLTGVRLMPNAKDHYIFGQTITKIGDSTVVFHEGVSGNIYLSRIPSRNISIVTIGNRHEWFEDENKALVNFILKEPDKGLHKPTFITKPIAATKDELVRYEGRYLLQNQTTWQSNVSVRRTNDFFVADGVLNARFPGNIVYPLTPVGKGIFYTNQEGFGVQITFHQPDAISPLEALIEFDDGFPSTRMKREPKIWAPAKSELERLAGIYHSKHLDFYWTIILSSNGQLLVRRPTISDTELVPDLENEFRLTIEERVGNGFDAWVKFHRDSNGKVTHLTVHYPRLMDHRFDRVSK